MPKFDIYVDGDWYPWTYLKYGRSFRMQSQPFVVEIPGIESFAASPVVEIKRDGDTVTKGYGTIRSWPIKDKVMSKIESRCYRRKWERLPGVFTSPDTEASTHLENQLADTGLTKGTFNNYGAISLDYGATERSRFLRRDIADEIMFITGWEMYANPLGVCDFKSQCGTDRSSGAGAIVFSRVEGSLLDWERAYVETSLLKVDRITVMGRGIGDFQAWGRAQIGGYSSGDPERIVNRRTLLNNVVCGTAAIALLADMDNVVKYGMPKVVNAYDGLAFDVFDTIRIKDEILGIDKNLRVAGYSVEARAEEGELTSLSLCNIDHLQTSGDILIGEVRARVEDDYTRSKQIVDRIIFEFGGEHEAGYDVTESGGGMVSIFKNLIHLQMVSIAGRAICEGAGGLVDFSLEPAMEFQFMIKDSPQDQEDFYWIGLWNSVTEKGILFYLLDDDELYSFTSTGPADGTSKIISHPFTRDVWQRGAIYVREGVAYFYYNGELVSTHGIGEYVPTTGTSKPLYCDLYVPAKSDGRGYDLHINYYVASQQWG